MNPSGRFPRILFFGSLIFLILPAAAPALVLADIVRYVIDGDTLVLENTEHVRLIGINAPEIDHPEYGRIGEPFGKESAEYLRGLVEGKDVRLENGSELLDRYGRRLAYVYRQDGLFVNRRMIETGWAEVYRRFDFPQKPEFLELEKKARQAKIGMWAGPSGGDDWKQQFLHWLSAQQPSRKTAVVSADK